MWIVYSLVSNIFIIGIEFIYRKGIFDSFASGLPYIILPILISQYCLFHSFKDAPNYLLAWAVFTVGNVMLRFVANYYVGEQVTTGAFVGIAMILSGAFVMKVL